MQGTVLRISPILIPIISPNKSMGVTAASDCQRLQKESNGAGRKEMDK